MIMVMKTGNDSEGERRLVMLKPSASSYRETVSGKQWIGLGTMKTEGDKEDV